MRIANIFRRLQPVRIILFLFVFGLFPLFGDSRLFAQTKPAVASEASNAFGEGGTKTTTSWEGFDGERIIETQYFDPAGNLMEKVDVLIGEESQVTVVKQYDDKGNVKYKRFTQIYHDGKGVNDEVEHYEAGQMISGNKLSIDINGQRRLKTFDPKTGKYEDQETAEAEKYEKKIKETFGDTYFNPAPPANYSKADPSANPSGYEVATAAYTGISTHTFSSPFGRLDVNLPDRIAPGDTITGSLAIYPIGKTPDDLKKNEAELKGFRLQLPDDLFVNVEAGKPFTFTVPASINRHSCRLSLFRNKTPLAVVVVQLIEIPAAEESFIFPTGGQQGRYCRMRGRFNGRLDENDFVQLGEKPMMIVAESPRERVMLNEYDYFGQTKIVVGESGVRRECFFRNIGLKMSADKLDLLRGESTTLRVQVLGLNGINQEIPLTLVNNTPTVIKMSQGDTQSIKITSGMVKSDGVFSVDRRLSSIVTGSFSINGTVTWDETCIAQ